MGLLVRHCGNVVSTYYVTTIVCRRMIRWLSVTRSDNGQLKVDVSDCTSVYVIYSQIETIGLTFTRCACVVLTCHGFAWTIPTLTYFTGVSGMLLDPFPAFTCSTDFSWLLLWLEDWLLMSSGRLMILGSRCWYTWQTKDSFSSQSIMFSMPS